MKKGIEKHKEFLIGILIGIIPMIIKIAGWTAILIVLLLVITFSIYIFYIQTETGMKEEEEFQKLFKKIDEELKNVVPEAYTVPSPYAKSPAPPAASVVTLPSFT